MSLQEKVAILPNRAKCNIEDQISADFFFDDLLESENQLQDTFNHFNSLKNSGNKYCNFFAYLVCQHDPRTTNTHRCLCPPGMIWESRKCVFEKYHRCDNFNSMKGINNRRFVVFDFIREEYSRDIAPRCEFPTICRQTNICEEDKRFDFYAPPTKIAVSMINHLDGGM